MLGLTSALSSSSEKEQNYALSFDGVNDYVDLGPSNGIMTASQDPISFSCWVKTTLTSQGYIFSCQRSDGGSAFSVKIADNGIASGVIWNGVSAHTFPESTTAVNDGNWHHLAIVAKDGNQKIYVDGALEDTHTSTMDVVPSADHCSIGAHTAGATFRYNGSLTGLAVYTVELDADAITSIYNAGRHHNLNTPISNYSSTPSHYYALGHGLFDEKASGFIHDQANPGFGSELTTNGDFSTSGTVGNNTWTLGFRTSDGGISIADGILDLVNEDNSDFDGRVQFTNGVDAGLTIENSKRYLFEYEITENSSSSNFYLYKGGGYISIAKTVGHHKYYFESTGTQVYVRNGANNSTIKLSVLSLKKLNNAAGVVEGATFVADN